MPAALIVSCLGLGAFWLAVYDAGPLAALVVIIEAVILVALAFGHASRSSSPR